MRMELRVRAMARVMAVATQHEMLEGNVKELSVMSGRLVLASQMGRPWLRLGSRQGTVLGRSGGRHYQVSERLQVVQ